MVLETFPMTNERLVLNGQLFVGDATYIDGQWVRFRDYKAETSRGVEQRKEIERLRLDNHVLNNDKTALGLEIERLHPFEKAALYVQGGGDLAEMIVQCDHWLAIAREKDVENERLREIIATAHGMLCLGGELDAVGKRVKAYLERSAVEPSTNERPKCFEFAMEFLDEPEASEIRTYIERLERRSVKSCPEVAAVSHPGNPQQGTRANEGSTPSGAAKHQPSAFEQECPPLWDSPEKSSEPTAEERPTWLPPEERLALSKEVNASLRNALDQLPVKSTAEPEKLFEVTRDEKFPHTMTIAPSTDALHFGNWVCPCGKAMQRPMCSVCDNDE